MLFEMLSDVALPRLERLVFLGIARATMPLFLSRPHLLRCAIFNRFFAVAPPALALRLYFESAAHLCEVSLDSMNKL